MIDQDLLFLELIRISIGTQNNLSKIPSETEWRYLFIMSQKQSLIGICFEGIRKCMEWFYSDSELDSEEILSKLNIPEDIYYQWLALSLQIERRNEAVSSAVGIVKAHFDEEGFKVVLLKGQGNLCNYPERLRILRTPGDIDVWIMSKELSAKSVNDQLKNDEYVLKHFWRKDSSIRHCYIHIHENLFDDIDVEIHYRPSFINSFIRNARFQRWATQEYPKQFNNIVNIPAAEEVSVAVPTVEFNIVYQLNHMFRHIFDDGLGFRQILDYYFLLTQNKGIRSDLTKQIKRFGMNHFCGSLMYVMQKAMGLKEEYTIAKPDHIGGEFLLSEIMTAGNFGHYDKREKIHKNENGIQRFFRRQKRNTRFLGEYPEEVLSVPLFRLYQEYWRHKMSLKYKKL